MYKTPVLNAQAHRRLKDVGRQSLHPDLSLCIQSCTKADIVEAYRKWRKGMGAPGVKEGIGAGSGTDGALPGPIPAASLLPTRPVHRGPISRRQSFECNPARLSQQNPDPPLIFYFQQEFFTLPCTTTGRQASCSHFCYFHSESCSVATLSCSKS